MSTLITAKVNENNKATQNVKARTWIRRFPDRAFAWESDKRWDWNKDVMNKVKQSYGIASWKSYNIVKFVNSKKLKAIDRSAAESASIFLQYGVLPIWFTQIARIHLQQWCNQASKEKLITPVYKEVSLPSPINTPLSKLILDTPRTLMFHRKRANECTIIWCRVHAQWRQLVKSYKGTTWYRCDWVSRQRSTQHIWLAR